MKITLQVNGREMTFSTQELIAIVEEHLSNKITEQTTTAKMVKKPTEDEWFEVKPQSIDQKLFENKREDNIQEATRQLILEAFDEMNNNPKKYGKNFKTKMPEKTWSSKSCLQLKEIANKNSCHIADWIEQSLEWAQRIANGESWKSICNDRDTANWYRLVKWKNGYFRLIGGSIYVNSLKPASHVHVLDYNCHHILLNTIPLVVLYEK